MFTIYKKHLSTLALLMLMFWVSAFTSCKNDDEAPQTYNFLESFGPCPIARGGELTFIGADLSSVQSVEFPGGETVTPTFISSGKFTVKVPESALPGNLILHTSNGDITTLSPIGFSEPVEVVSFSPQEQRPGSEVTITGKYLSNATYINIGDVKIPLQPISDDQKAIFDKYVTSLTNTELKFKVPAEAATGDLTLTDGKPVLCGELTVTLPKPTEVSATNLKAGDVITITGQDLDLVTKVVFNDAVVDVEPTNATSIAVKVPAEAKDGAVAVVTASGVSVDTKAEITLVKPVINDIEYIRSEENDGKITYYYFLGDELTITGSDLDLITSLTLGDYTLEKSEYTIADDNNSITLIIPKKAKSGIKAVTGNATEVTTDLNIKPIDVSGAYWSYDTNGEKKYIGGGKVVITACNNLLNYAVDARIGDEPVRDFKVIDNNSFSFVVPEYINGTQQLFVKSTNGEETQVWNIAVEECPHPYLSKIPKSAILGGNIFVEGGNLDKVTSVSIAGINIPVYSVASKNGMFINIPGTKSVATNDYIIVSDGSANVSSATKINITLAEVTLLEQTQDLGIWSVNWSVFPQDLFKDITVGSTIKIYVSVNDLKHSKKDEDDESGFWQLQFFDGAWGKYTAFDGGNNINGPASAITDGYISFTVNESFYNSLQTNTNWGGAIIIQGENLTVKKISFIP